MDERFLQTMIPPTLTLGEALRVVDKAGLCMALVVDAEQRLMGILTDGDIRRAILRGVHLDRTVVEIMNRNPQVASPSTDAQVIRNTFLQHRLNQLPILDENRRIVNVLLRDEWQGIPLSQPDITEQEAQAVLNVLRSPNLSLGPKVAEFEAQIAAYAGRKYGVTVNSGTSGLHLVIRALGLKTGDEVVTTPFSFIASSNCLLYEGVKPIFVDIDPQTYNIDPDRVEDAIGPHTKGILAVDVFGQPADYSRLAEMSARRGVPLITDCCESIGAMYRGTKASTYGVAGVFGFYPNKQITTGEGGAIVTDDPEIARLCKSMRNQGRSEEGGWLAHERLGFNYRLSDLSCALGIVQLERIEDILKKREAVAREYTRLLSSIKGIVVPHIHPDITRMSWFVYVVRLSDEFSRGDRDRLIQRLGLRGINANRYFPPIHLQPFYREQFGFREGDFPITERIGERTLALPFHNNLSEGVIARIVEAVSVELGNVSRQIV